MHFMTIVKGAEGGPMPPQALFDAIEVALKKQQEAGILVGWGGLMPSSQGARIRIKGDKMHVIDGPFAESKEVIGGYSILKVDSREEVIRLAREFMDLHIEHWPGWEGECEIRELADFG